MHPSERVLNVTRGSILVSVCREMRMEKIQYIHAAMKSIAAFGERAF